MRKVLSVITITLMLIAAISTVAFASSRDSGFDGKYVEAEGTAAPGQGLVMEQLAARIDAMRNLAGIINGVHIDSETTVNMKVVTNDIVKAKIQGLIKGAEVVSEGYDKNGVYTVKMRVSAFGETESIATSVMEPWTQEPIPAPKKIVPEVQEQGYTGVIIDCRGLDISTAMSPVIRNADHQPIYGHKNLDYKEVVAHGMAAYSHGMVTIDRAGSHPIMVKAIGVDGYFYPVVSNADADKILTANLSTHFLEKRAVVIVRD